MLGLSGIFPPRSSECTFISPYSSRQRDLVQRAHCYFVGSRMTVLNASLTLNHGCFRSHPSPASSATRGLGSRMWLPRPFLSYPWQRRILRQKLIVGAQARLSLALLLLLAPIVFCSNHLLNAHSFPTPGLCTWLPFCKPKAVWDRT